ncbi:hypothetical protein VCV18_012287 [Metarhizium anisopliae]
MHLSTLINSFSQLQAAATNIRDPTTGTGRAVTGALREIHWERTSATTSVKLPSMVRLRRPGRTTTRN